RDNPTIKLLYRVAKQIFKDEAAKEDVREDANDIICSKAVSQSIQVLSVLVKDVSELQAHKRTKDCLQDGLKLIEELCTIYIPLYHLQALRQ
ncbi:hypothetical protein BDB00DRAFT_757759, partial [Zychaea mexicana]|uniref:uncharacterized protein n=1 Tax=Zychaea mexicana TaxID=64656 RepID=UPI0022FE969D